MMRPLTLVLCLIAAPEDPAGNPARLAVRADPEARPSLEEEVVLLRRRGWSGSVVAHGGKVVHDDQRATFVELGGGAEARFVLVPTASDAADDRSEADWLQPWQSLEMASRVVRHAPDRERADDPAFAAGFADATAVWIGGGSQGRLRDVYHGTATHRAWLELLERGGVIGGTSAGAAILGDSMIRHGNPEAVVEEGFGFLPGAVVDQHFLARDRVNRLLGVLWERPGEYGLGVDEGTMVVARGRELEVQGSSSVLQILTASPRRSLTIHALGDGDRDDLRRLANAARMRARRQHPGDGARPVVRSGSLLMAGGGELPDAVWRRFVELCGGEGARLVLIPTAWGEEVEDDPGTRARLEQAGAAEVRSIHPTQDEDELADQLRALDAASGLWFTGGRQWRLVDAYAGGEIEAAVHRLLERGGAVGGTSAGATIQGEYLVRGDPRTNTTMMAEGYEQGFGLLPGVAIDQHFGQRARQADLISVLQRFPRLWGIGLDEGTAAIARGAELEVVGANRVWIYASPREAPTVLTEGQRFEWPLER